ncbi:MAG: GIY-YIG nuclease family protein [Pseudohongiellaceae bacterium]
MLPETDKQVVWSLYLIRSVDASLYTGVSTDVWRRFAQHENKDKKNKGAKALRGKAPLRLVFVVVVGNRSAALKMEYRVKQLNRAQKEELITLPTELEEVNRWLQDK